MSTFVTPSGKDPYGIGIDNLLPEEVEQALTVTTETLKSDEALSRWWSGGTHMADKGFFNKQREILLQAYHLCLPPPARGRSVESDGGSSSYVGFGEESKAARYGSSSGPLRLLTDAVVASKGDDGRLRRRIRQPGSWEAATSNTTLAARRRRQSSTASTKPIHLPAKDSGEKFNLQREAPSRSTTV
jgi:hypothetical protein